MKAMPHQHRSWTIHTIPVRVDNYVYLIEWSDGLVLIDAGEAGPIIPYIEQLNKPLQSIVITHGHIDHIAGLEEVKRHFDVPVYAPNDPGRIPVINQVLAGGDRCPVGSKSLLAVHTPGHLHIHHSYYFEDAGVLFSGDALFLGGCGRLFEGTPAQMWDTFQILNHFPAETAIYCGHEYSQSNLAFAQSIVPDDSGIQEQSQRVAAALAKSRPSVPGRLDWERQSNLFMRSDDPVVQSALGMSTCDPSETFREIRERRNNW